MLRLTTIALASLAATARADLHVVDAAAGAGADFVEISDAVAAAADGDVILIRTGEYGPVAIDGKALVLSADEAADVSIAGIVHVTNLSAGQSVTVSGVAAQACCSQESPTFSVRDCAGSVLVQDSSLKAFLSEPLSVGDAAEVLNSASVTFVRTEMDADVGELSVFAPQARGLYVEASNVGLFECSLLGVEGLAGDSINGDPGAKGGAGLAVVGPGRVTASGSTISGGAGGFGGMPQPFGPNCTDGGDGGPGVQLLALAPTFFDQDSNLVGGPGGAADPSCQAGATGPSTVVKSGSIVPVLSAARGIETTSPVRAGEQLTSTYTGLEGDAVFSFWALAQGPTPHPLLAGLPILPSLPPLSLDFKGSAPAGGVLQASGTVLGLGLPAATIYLQALFYNVSEGFVLSNPQMVLLLDASV